MSKTDLNVLVAGNPRWAKILTDELAQAGIQSYHHPGLRNSLRHLKFTATKKFLSAKILHWVYAPMKFRRLFVLAKRMKKKVVIHWIGTDLLEVKEYFATCRCLPDFFGTLVDEHLAISAKYQQELASLGINAKIIRLISNNMEVDVQPLPPKPAVLTYWPALRANFYGCDLVMRLVRHFPDISFYVVGSEKPDAENVPANVSFLGEVDDINSIYRRISILIRFTEHDGAQPAMVLEALARGKYVLFRYPFPHTMQITGFDDAVSALQQLRDAKTPNMGGATYVHENFSWREEIQKLKGIYSELLS